MKIIAYTFEADVHCVYCTQKRHKSKPFDTWGKFEIDEHGLPETAEDSEGNFIHHVFDTDEWPGGKPVCGDCAIEIGL